MKLKMPKMGKTGMPAGGARAHAPRLPHRGIRTAAAFGSGGTRAFNDPATMTAPDQAFGAAMAMPQDGGAGAPADVSPAPAAEG